jgi:hypothetical protein
MGEVNPSTQEECTVGRWRCPLTRNHPAPRHPYPAPNTPTLNQQRLHLLGNYHQDLRFRPPSQSTDVGWRHHGGIHHH